MRRPVSLNSHVNWLTALELMDIKPAIPAFPAMVKCPLCFNNSLTIVSDTAFGGQWHYCKHCQTSGSMISLVQAYFKESYDRAVRRLYRAGCGLRDEHISKQAIIQDYELYVTRPGNLQEFTERVLSAPRVLESNTAINKLKFGKNVLGLPDDAWKRGPGRLLGVTNTVAAEKVFHQGVEISELTGNEKSQRLFQGRDWGKIIAVPLYDIPGRVRSVAFIGRNMTQKDIVVRSLYTKKVGGLAIHPKAITGEKPLVLTQDLLFYLRSQLSHYSEKREPLNLAFWACHPRTGLNHSWDLVRGRQLVFWSPEFNGPLLKNAMLVDGLISVPLTGNHAASSKNLARFDSARRLKKIVDSAVPWHEAFVDFVHAADKEDIARVFQDAMLPGESVTELLKYCDKITRDRLTSATGQNLRHRFVEIFGTRVEDRDDGWWKISTTGKASLLTDAKMYIDSVAVSAQTDDIYYKGRVVFKGKTVPFCEKQNVVEGHPGKLIRETVIRAGLGVPRFTAHYWQTRLFNLAINFQEPKLEEKLEAAGWNPAESSFEFPTFSIRFPGEVKSQQKVVTMSGMPCTNFQPPEIIDPFTAQTWTLDTEENQLRWALQLAVLTNILSPAFNEPATNVAVCGDAASKIAGLVQTDSGCNKVTVFSRKYNALLDPKLEQARFWPLFYEEKSIFKYPKAIKHLLDSEVRNLILPVNWYQTLSCLINGGWLGVVCDQLPTPPERESDRSTFIPAYLEYLLKSKLSLPEAETFVDSVTASVAGFINSLKGYPDTILAASSLIQLDSEESNAYNFVELLHVMLSNGLMQYSTQQRIVLDKLTRKNKLLYVPLYAFNAGLAKRAAPPLNKDRVSLHLTSVNALIGEELISNVPFWIIDDVWIQKEFRRIERQTIGTPKLASL